jgi:phospholipid/cholesterol/gamma-HCH transport system permease protein
VVRFASAVLDSALKNILVSTGRFTLDSLRTSGEVAILAGDTLRCIFKYPLRWKLIFEQLYLVGVRSQTVILTTGAFTGAVFAAQIQYQFARLGMESATGPTVSVAMCRELGPVLCALLLAGRVGASMAAELSSMKITEQLDAIRSMGVYPTEFLIVPRFLALMVSAPILTAQALAVGIGCGYFVAVPILGIDGAYYWDNTFKFTDANDVMIGLTKGTLFGAIISVISCHKGLYAPNSTAGVGVATTEAVVNSCLAVLVANFFFTFLLNNLLPSN